MNRAQKSKLKPGDLIIFYTPLGEQSLICKIEKFEIKNNQLMTCTDKGDFGETVLLSPRIQPQYNKKRSHPMKNDVKNHNKTKENVDEYVKEKVTKFIKLLLGGLPDGLECKHLEDFIRQIINECKARVSKEKIFVQHIENHLKTMGIKGKVICKICGKDIDTIADKEVIE